MIPTLAYWVKDSGIAVSYGVGCRLSSDLVVLWLWHRPAATAPTLPLAWEPLYATGVALKSKIKTKKICPNPGPSAQFEDFISSSQDPVSLLKALSLLIISMSSAYSHLINSLPLTREEPNKIVQMLKSPDSPCPIFTMYSSGAS